VIGNLPHHVRNLIVYSNTTFQTAQDYNLLKTSTGYEPNRSTLSDMSYMYCALALVVVMTMAAGGETTTRQAADVPEDQDQQTNLHNIVMGPRSARPNVVIGDASQSQATKEGAGTTIGYVNNDGVCSACNAMLSYAIDMICYAMLSNAKPCYTHITAQASAGIAHLKQLESKSKDKSIRGHKDFKEVKNTGGEAAEFTAPSQVHLTEDGHGDLRVGSVQSGKELGAPIHAGCATGQVGAAHMQAGNATSTRLYAATVAKAKVKFKDKDILHRQ
jgi:hypothetical protein